ncbi:patatin-like phospholipase family protein [Conexibacter stalactiti]|uniref:Patatin-like phospholipase family protein n=1 Tax=Conexibacter stalactiti TaxID=1940611 RepID=A0ABU4HTU7_9ACTN|nr:patatin-like phospholipase family protein [Conexibacter stalactiti]MDW5596740.1 patatin-like phospholipase family protein [Conexibacter stalactiti]MEC5037382.1 patatin-like phospholipase family protein [Conexibacter stalactiti]
MIDRPDVLVLGAGGALAERWMHGLLAGFAEGAGIDARAVEQFVGTSAGAIVAAHLLAGRAPQRPDGADDGERGADDRDAGAHEAERGADEAERGSDVANAGADDADRATDDAGASQDAGGPGRARRLLGAVPGGVGKIARAAGGPLAPYALAATRPPGSLLRANVLGRLEPQTATLDELGRRLARDGLRFDGRLRVIAVERESGRRVVFGAPGAPRATVAEAIQASCSVPWLYRPVRIGGHDYVDGGLWSPTSIDVAPAARETRVLCLNPTGSSAGDAAPHGVIRTTSRSAAALEALTLRRRGAEVTVIAPDRAAASALSGGWIGHDAAAPAEQALAAGFRQGLALARGS